MRTTSLPDQEDLGALLAEASNGSPEALARLFSTYRTMVFGIALRIVASPSDAEDVMQDVFVGLPEALQSVEGEGSFEGWLRRVTTRVALMRVRRARFWRPVKQSMELVADPQRPDAVIERVDIEQALAQLPVRLRLVFVLKEIEGYSHAEIATLLGISKSASEVRLFRARKRLQKLLGGPQ